VVNRDCGATVDPIPFNFLLESFGILALAITIGWVVQRLRTRYPAMTTARLVLVVLAISLVFEVLLDGSAVALGLWDYAPFGPTIHLGPGLQLPLIEVGAALCSWALLVAVRLVKDGRGRTVVERGVDRHSPKVARAISLLALYAIFILVAWVPGGIPDIVGSSHEGPWPKTPSYLVNNMCNAPGITGTRYGPCPGGPG
jgi:hypothetical protein